MIGGEANRSTRRDRLNQQFRREAAQAAQAATPAETHIIDALNDGDLRPLSRYLWKQRTLTTRLAFFLSLLIRDPGDVGTTMLQIVPKHPERGRPDDDHVDTQLLGRKIAAFVASSETGKRSGAKIGLSLAEEEFGMSRSTIKRYIKPHIASARRKIAHERAIKSPNL